MTGWILAGLVATCCLAAAVFIYFRDKREEAYRRARDGKWYGREKR